MTHKKKPLQVYLLDEERRQYNELCKSKGVTATSELRRFVLRQVNKNKNSNK